MSRHVPRISPGNFPSQRCDGLLLLPERMKELFRERDFTRIGYYRSILESNGVETLIRNEMLSGAEVSIPEFFPALCVVNDADYDRALALIRQQVNQDGERSEEEVDCPECNEKNPGNFEICWSCGGSIGFPA